MSHVYRTVHTSVCPHTHTLRNTAVHSIGGGATHPTSHTRLPQPTANDALLHGTDTGELRRVGSLGQAQVLVVGRAVHHKDGAARQRVRCAEEAPAMPRVAPPVRPNDVRVAAVFAGDGVAAGPALEPVEVRGHVVVLPTERCERGEREAVRAPAAWWNREGVQRLAAGLVPPARRRRRPVPRRAASHLQITGARLRETRVGGHAVVAARHGGESGEQLGALQLPPHRLARGIHGRACVLVVDLRHRLERLGDPKDEGVRILWWRAKPKGGSGGAAIRTRSGVR
mmetsp:Transcript_26951/g.80319  ORF Transcript_26951/g.80319 Transcript_26951/m.80319 type:complete len:284 (+) Transcript_26951:147-998(+)